MRVAAFLKPRLGAPGERAFVLARSDATWTFAILNADADALTPAAETLFAKEATDVSRAVFGGTTAEVVVYDRAFQPKRTFRSESTKNGVPERLLAQAHEGKTIEAWLNQLLEPHREKVAAAADALVRLGPAGAPLVPALMAHSGRFSGSDEDGLLPAVARVLVAIGPDAAPVLIPYATASSPADPDRRRLAEILGEPTGRHRQIAHDALRAIGPGALATLRRLRDDVRADPEERAGALVVVADLDSGEWLAALRAVLAWATDPDRLVRARGLRWLGHFPAGAERAVPVLVRALDDSDRDIRRAALDGLGRLGAIPAAPAAAIVKRLTDPDEGVRRGAIDALDRMDSGREYAPDLHRMFGLSAPAAGDTPIQAAARRLHAKLTRPIDLYRP